MNNDKLKKIRELWPKVGEPFPIIRKHKCFTLARIHIDFLFATLEAEREKVAMYKYFHGELYQDEIAQREKEHE